MLIAKAYAQALETAVEIGDVTGQNLPPAPTPMEAFMWNMGMVLILVVLFYVLLIRPQQKRFREHSEMLTGLKKGDKVVTGGGLVGKVAKIEDGNPEVEVDLGNGMKVTAVRSTLQSSDTPLLKKQDEKEDKSKKDKSKDSKKK